LNSFHHVRYAEDFDTSHKSIDFNDVKQAFVPIQIQKLKWNDWNEIIPKLTFVVFECNLLQISNWLRPACFLIRMQKLKDDGEKEDPFKANNAISNYIHALGITTVISLGINAQGGYIGRLLESS